MTTDDERMNKLDGLYYPELESLATGRAPLDEVKATVAALLAKPMAEWSFGETSLVFACAESQLVQAEDLDATSEADMRYQGMVYNAVTAIYMQLLRMAPSLRETEEDWRAALLAKL